MGKTLFGEDEVARIRNTRNKDGSFTINPCIAVYGKGPEGTKCKTCDMLVYIQLSKRYYKCEMRNITNGPASDHRVNFPSCGKYGKYKKEDK